MKDNEGNDNQISTEHPKGDICPHGYEHNPVVTLSESSRGFERGNFQERLDECAKKCEVEPRCKAFIDSLRYPCELFDFPKSKEFEVDNDTLCTKQSK